MTIVELFVMLTIETYATKQSNTVRVEHGQAVINPIRVGCPVARGPQSARIPYRVVSP